MKKGLGLVGALLTGLLGVFGCGANTSMKAANYFEPPMVELLTAISKGDEARAEALLEQGLDLNIIGKADITPLFWFIARQDKAGMKLALKLGADPNFRNGYGNNPVCFVTGAKDNEWLQLLMASGGGSKQ